MGDFYVKYYIVFYLIMNAPREMWFYCKVCKKFKEEMEMHSIDKELCKNCWARADKKHQLRKGRYMKKL